MNPLKDSNFDSISKTLQNLEGSKVEHPTDKPGGGVNVTSGPKQRTIVKLVARVFPEIARKFENYNVHVVKNGKTELGFALRNAIIDIKENLNAIQQDIISKKNDIKSLDAQIKTTLANDQKANIHDLAQQRTEAYKSLTDLKSKWSATKDQISKTLNLSNLPFLAGTSVMVQLGRTEKKLEAQFEKAFPSETGNADWYKLQSYQEQIKGLLGAIDTLQTLDFTGLSVSSDKEIAAKENKIRDLFGECMRIWRGDKNEQEVDARVDAKYTEISQMVPEKYHTK